MKESLAMKKIFRAWAVLAASLLISSPLAASSIESFSGTDSLDFQVFNMDNRSMDVTSLRGEYVRIPPSILLFEANQFEVKEGTGAVETELSGIAPLPVIEYPEGSNFTIDVDLGPTASVSFSIPPGYDEKLGSVIGFKFLSGSSLVAGSIQGSVKFKIQAEVIHKDSTTEIIPLGRTTTRLVVSAGPAQQGEISANQYTAKVKVTGEFSPGDIVNLELIRDNTDENGNYQAPVYVPGLFLKYNVGKKAKVKSNF